MAAAGLRRGKRSADAKELRMLSAHQYRVDTRATKRATITHRPLVFKSILLNHLTVGNFLYELFRVLPDELVLAILAFLPKSSICNALAAGLDSRRTLFVAEICRMAMRVFTLDCDGLPRRVSNYATCRKGCGCMHGRVANVSHLVEPLLDLSQTGVTTWLLRRKWSYVEQCWKLVRFSDEKERDLCQLYWDNVMIFDPVQHWGHQPPRQESILASDPVFLARFALCVIQDPLPSIRFEDEQIDHRIAMVRRMLRGRKCEPLVVEIDYLITPASDPDRFWMPQTPRRMLKLPKGDPLREQMRWKVDVHDWERFAEGNLDLDFVCVYLLRQ
jgi:hypothetical protein